jgi:hypothetical protein
MNTTIPDFFGVSKVPPEKVLIKGEERQLSDANLQWALDAVKQMLTQPFDVVVREDQEGPGYLVAGHRFYVVATPNKLVVGLASDLHTIPEMSTLTAENAPACRFEELQKSS